MNTIFKLGALTTATLVLAGCASVNFDQTLEAVSYTHLTLPTIYSV